jgi:hypothetical protein
VGAALDAWLAVRAGVRIDDFLRHRLARYATRLPVPLESLPVTVDVEGGEAVIRSRPAPGLLGPRLGATGRALALSPDGAWTDRALHKAKAAIDALAAREAVVRARQEAAERDLEAALDAGTVVARPAIDATPEQLGRPAVDSPWPVHGLRALAGALLAAEAWRFAGPALAAAGVARDGVDAALVSAPVPAGLALLAALGAAASAFTFAWFALVHGPQAAAATSGRARGRLLLAWATGTALLVPSVAGAAAAPDPVSGLVLAATLPFAGAALWRWASALAERRATAAATALEWDRERAREELERGRREQACTRAAVEARAAGALREEAEARLRVLHREAAAAARIAELTLRAEAVRLERLSEGLAAALEQDRYLYLRTAGDPAPVSRERPARARVVDPAVGPERLGVTG